MKSVLPAGAVLLAATISGGCVVVDSQAHIVRDEKRFTVSGVPDVKLSTFDGAIEIRTGDDKTVIVEIEKRGPTEEAIGRLTVDAKQEGNRIEVAVKKPAGDVGGLFIGHSSPTAKLIVTMPTRANVTATSGDGSIRAEKVHGTLDLRTGDGSIRGSGIGGELTLHTGDGSIAVDDIDGSVDLDTGDGSVSVAGTPGVVKMHTGDGSVTLRAESGTMMKDNWSIDTGDGGVTLYLPSDFAADLDASTNDGRIQTELTVNTDNGGEVKRRSARGRIGAGGKALRIRTGDGSIRLRTS